MTDVPTIHVLMAKILGELPAIGKDSYNEQQRFHFRGIDQVMNALNPLLAKYGVFYMPDVVERIDSERSTSKGGVMYVVNLHVRYRFYGPHGDYIEASGWGEGTDMGDKATNKAMTGAMKYVLFQTFAISTAEAAENDADGSSPEETTGARRSQNAPLAEQTVPATVANKLAERINALPDEARVRCKREFAEQFGKPAELKRGDAEAAEALVAGYEVTAAVSPPEGKGEPPPPDSVERDQASAPAITDAGAKPMTGKQRSALFALMAEQGITDDIRHGWASNILNRPVASFSDLTAADAAALLDHLSKVAS